MRLAYVGMPCDIEALGKLEALAGEAKQEWVSGIEYKVGLFCMENWYYTCFRALVQDDFRIKLEEVAKFNIKKNNLIAQKKNGATLQFPVHESYPFVRVSCQVCLDFTADIADIAVGAVGAPDKWSAVIVRTKKGLELLKGAEKEGYVEARHIAEVKPGVETIKKIARRKMERNGKEIAQRESEGLRVLHVKYLKDNTLDAVRSAAKGKAFEELDYDVIDNGLCTSCGNCIVSCPNSAIEMREERPTKVKECKEGCEACYLVCPRAGLPMAAFEAKLGDASKSEDGIGKFIEIFAVRAKDAKVHEAGQDGGAVTALLSYALDKKLVDAVLSVKGSEKEPWRPLPFVSRDKAELLKTSKTYYSYATTIPAAKQLIAQVRK